LFCHCQKLIHEQKMAAVLNKKGATKIKVGIAKAAVKAAARPPMAPASRDVSRVC
jgi:hypothetical protein